MEVGQERTLGIMGGMGISGFLMILVLRRRCAGGGGGCLGGRMGVRRVRGRGVRWGRRGRSKVLGGYEGFDRQVEMGKLGMVKDKADRNEGIFFIRSGF